MATHWRRASLPETSFPPTRYGCLPSRAVCRERWYFVLRQQPTYPRGDDLTQPPTALHFDGKIARSKSGPEYHEDRRPVPSESKDKWDSSGCVNTSPRRGGWLQPRCGYLHEPSVPHCAIEAKTPPHMQGRSNPPKSSCNTFFNCIRQYISGTNKDCVIKGRHSTTLIPSAFNRDRMS